MKKSIILLFVLIIGFFIISAQILKTPKNENPIKIINTNTNSKVNDVRNYYKSNSKSEVINSQTGVISIGQNHIPFTTEAIQSGIEAYSNPSFPGIIMVGWNSYGPTFYGGGCAYTSNVGLNWTESNRLLGFIADTIASGISSIYNNLGNNDNKRSLFYNNLYIGWPDFSLSPNQIKYTRSKDEGINLFILCKLEQRNHNISQ